MTSIKISFKTYNQRETTMKKAFKFSVACFTPGTLFTVNDDMLNCIPGAKELNEFEVQAVYRNGVDSYVIETPKPHPGIDETNISMNTAHVASIIKRGPGSFVIHERQNNKAIIEYYVGLMEKNRFDSFDKDKMKSLKTHHRTISPEFTTRFVLATMNISIEFADCEALSNAIMSQSFAKAVEVDWFTVFVINKKRMKRFIKQNVNRFRITAKRALKEENDFNDRTMEADMCADRCFDGDFDEDDVSEDRSCDDDQYMNTDDIRDCRAMDQMEDDLDLNLDMETFPKKPN